MRFLPQQSNPQKFCLSPFRDCVKMVKKNGLNIYPRHKIRERIWVLFQLIDCQLKTDLKSLRITWLNT
jgi:hypothetical protein